ncbi:MAG: hypothetical protein HGA44_04600, partial [Cellulomonadaceae bacterium]|nr:hypothetical protein [Cellulomonadaceae bacterium]
MHIAAVALPAPGNNGTLHTFPCITWYLRSAEADGEPKALILIEQAEREHHPFAVILLDGRIRSRSGTELAQKLEATSAPHVVTLIPLGQHGERTKSVTVVSPLSLAKP